MDFFRGHSARRREVRKSVTKAINGTRRSDRIRLIWWLVFFVAFTLVGGLIAVSGLTQPRYRDGDIATEPILARVDFDAIDNAKTEKKRLKAEENKEAVYDLHSEFFNELREHFDALVHLGADKSIQQIEQIPDGTPGKQWLTNVGLTALGNYWENGELKPTWEKMVDQFLHGDPDLETPDGLAGIAMLSDEDYKQESERGKIRITTGPRKFDDRYRNRWINVLEGQHKLGQRLTTLVDHFDKSLRPVAKKIVLENIQKNPRPIYIRNAKTTANAKKMARDAVEPVIIPYTANTTLVQPGDNLNSETLELLKVEQAAYHDHLTTGQRVATRLGQFGIMGLLTFGLWTYIFAYNPRVMRNPMRGLAIIALLLLCLALAVGGTQAGPSVMYLTATFPTLLAVIVLAIAYDQRFALAIGGLHTLMVVFSLNLSVGFATILLVGVGVALAQLNEVRTRSKLAQIGLWTGLAMATAALIVAFAQRPLSVDGELIRIGRDCGAALVSGMFVGMFVQGILPLLERVFKVTTSMTLKELNDASHPLLQRMAQFAPGTYAHSLRLADISEAAAEAIGASSLLCRVGAMYHDIGKMNKPAYFIENQGGGPNRHAKLSPAMSVLIIVGHVKDGIEMAREYALPLELRHFIESHHGTTLVEYFYHAAKQQRDAGDQPAPTEFEFRYPGPKPQTREAAILMLGDSIESATRTLADPTPGRIEQLVHTIAQKRLMDSQFDECNLTLQELHNIEAALTKTLCASYHSRIRYPEKGQGSEPPQAEPDEPAA